MLRSEICIISALLAASLCPARCSLVARAILNKGFDGEDMSINNNLASKSKKNVYGFSQSLPFVNEQKPGAKNYVDPSEGTISETCYSTNSPPRSSLSFVITDKAGRTWESLPIDPSREISSTCCSSADTKEQYVQQADLPDQSNATETTSTAAKSNNLSATMQDHSMLMQYQVGFRIAVYNPSVNQFFEAVVKELGPQLHDFLVKYRDTGDLEWIDVRTTRTRLLASSSWTQMNMRDLIWLVRKDA